MSYKILTVDDSRMVRLIVAKAFQPLGCDVYEASTGADGLATALAFLPDLIFLDITMADMSGRVVLEKMREIEALRTTPVIMLSAESGHNSIKRADQLKVAGYISKPFRGEQLVALAKDIFKQEPLVSP